MDNELGVDLSERQERCLARWLDGEAGWLDRLYVRCWLGRTKAAQSYISQLGRINAVLTDSVSEQVGGGAVDLWDRISTRLDQEEKAALFLGSRAIVSKHRPLVVSWPEKVVWGASGACVAVALVAVTVLIRPYSAMFESSQLAVSRLDASDPTLMASGNAEVGSYQVPTRLVSTQPVSSRATSRNWEMDWIRSVGSVSLVDDANGGSAVMWVNRDGRSRSSSAYRRPDGGVRLVVVDKPSGAPALSLVNNE